MNNFFLLALGPILLGCELVYIKMAKSFGVIDNPNSRSLHENPTIRGGGIIFPLAIILLFAFNRAVSVPFLVSIILISIVGILDDMKDLSRLLRFGAQAIVVALIFYDVGVNAHSWWVIALLLIIAVGTVNAYNFMDGINGITTGYSLVLLISLLYINSFVVEFVGHEVILTMIIALLVFGFFNFRKKAICFAGDVGSLSIGVAVIYLILKLTMVSHNSFSILLLSVYGVDSVFTIIHRLYLRQNIFKAHRLHLYQVVIASTKMPHLRMVFYYMTVQVIINSLIIYSFKGGVGEHILLAVFILGSLGLCYILVKRKYLKSR